MPDSSHYVIKGGREGRERLRVLGRVMHESSASLFDRLGVRNGHACLDVGCGGGILADSIARSLGNGDGGTVAWIHDYHLLLAPRMVRDRRPDAVIGFFLHVPFPAFEVFRILPTRREPMRTRWAAAPARM